MAKISLFKSVKETDKPELIEFADYLHKVKTGYWQDAVLKARAAKESGNKDRYQTLKKSAPLVTPSGAFSRRANDSLLEHSGIIAIDIDAQDNPDGIPLDELAADQYTYAIHKSIGGDGFVIYVRIEPVMHLDAFLGLERYYANQYQITIDRACKDVARGRLVSWDAELVINENSQVFKAYLEKKEKEPTNALYTQTRSDISHIVQQIERQRIDIVKTYYDWIRIGFALAGKYGESGRGDFHTICAQSPKYNRNDSDKKYTQLLKSGRGAVGIGTLVWYAQAAGLETKTPRTIAIESIARVRRAQVGQNGGYSTKEDAKRATLDYLQKMEGIEGEDVGEVVDAVLAANSDQLKTISGDIIEDAKTYLKSLNLRYNEVTHKIELDGEPLRDYTANGLYMDLLNVLKNTKGKHFSKEMFYTIIESPNTPKYNPFTAFFEANKHLQPEGNLRALLRCFEFDKSYTPAQLERLELLIAKWLVSIVASAHGTYSILCLVLCGAMGKGKTEFFRNLLPKQLRGYYAESKLDEGKDDLIKLTEKLLILDDEFAGKSKQDVRKMREVLAKQTIDVRKPYGRNSETRTRYAVLAGTSNEKDVLADLEGNRRIIPVNIDSINLDAYGKIDKTALFMELYWDYIKYGTDAWQLDDSDKAALGELGEQNEQTCQELEAFLMVFKVPEAGEYCESLTCTEIKSAIETASPLRISIKTLGAALKKLGIKQTFKKVGKTTKRVYEVVKNKQF